MVDTATSVIGLVLQVGGLIQAHRATKRVAAAGLLENTAWLADIGESRQDLIVGAYNLLVTVLLKIYDDKIKICGVDKRLTDYMKSLLSRFDIDDNMTVICAFKSGWVFSCGCKVHISTLTNCGNTIRAMSARLAVEHNSKTLMKDVQQKIDDALEKRLINLNKERNNHMTPELDIKQPTGRRSVWSAADHKLGIRNLLNNVTSPETENNVSLLLSYLLARLDGEDKNALKMDLLNHVMDVVLKEKNDYYSPHITDTPIIVDYKLRILLEETVDYFICDLAKIKYNPIQILHHHH